MPRTVTRLPARIVAIDERALAAIGPWPWPRPWLARLQQAAFDRGALAIGFDVVFAEPDRYGGDRLTRVYPGLSPEALAALAALPDPDAVFADSIARLPVVLGRVAVPEGGSPGPADSLPLGAEMLVDGLPPGRLLRFPAALSAVTPLDEAAAGHGLLNGVPDRDGVVRRVALVAEVGARIMPSLAMELLRVALDVDRITVTTLPSGAVGTVSVGDVAVPTDPQGRILMHFSPPLDARYVSAADLFGGSVPAGAFDGSVVIIGPAAVGLGDVVATPLTGHSFGVDLQAQIVEAIADGTWLLRPTWAFPAEWAVLVLLGVLVVAVLPGLRPSVALAVALATLAMLAGGGVAAFAGARLLLDPSLPMVGAGAASLSLLLAVMLETERRRKALRDALLAAQLHQARVDGELAAAREIQLGILPDPDGLTGLPPGLEVAALLEPAREIGGDLYDLFVLDERRLFFMVGDVTGKGVPAALFMTIAKVLGRSAVVRGSDDLAGAIAYANVEISRENPAELFVTALAGIIDAETGVVQFVNAGHDAPLRLVSGQGPEPLDSDGGPPLCVWEDFDYPLETATLAPGDTLLIATDGVTEARSPDGGLFGGARLNDLFADGPPEDGPGAAIERIRKAVRAYEAGGEPTDDLTVLALRYRPSGR